MAPHHVIQATTSEGLAKDPYVWARVGFEPATLRTRYLSLTHQAPTLTTLAYTHWLIPVTVPCSRHYVSLFYT